MLRVRRRRFSAHAPPHEAAPSVTIDPSHAGTLLLACGGTAPGRDGAPDQRFNTVHLCNTRDVRPSWRQVHTRGAPPPAR